MVLIVTPLWLEAKPASMSGAQAGGASISRSLVDPELRASKDDVVLMIHSANPTDYGLWSSSHRRGDLL